MEEPPDALLPAEGGALEARVRTCSAHAAHMQMQGALFTTYYVCSLRWAALPLTTYHLPLTTNY